MNGTCGWIPPCALPSKRGKGERERGRENSVLIGSIVFQPARIVQRREPFIRTQFPPGIGVVKCTPHSGRAIDSINLGGGGQSITVYRKVN